jgi:hypothetical protein
LFPFVSTVIETMPIRFLFESTVIATMPFISIRFLKRIRQSPNQLINGGFSPVNHRSAKPATTRPSPVYWSLLTNHWLLITVHRILPACYNTLRHP